MGSILAGTLLFAEGLMVGYSLAKSGVVEATYKSIKDKITKPKQELI